MNPAVHGVEAYALLTVSIPVLIGTLICGYLMFKEAMSHPLTGAGNPAGSEPVVTPVTRQENAR